MKTILIYRLFAYLALVLGLSACALNVKPINNININELKIIQRTYQNTISAAHTDNERTWNNGRLGNIIVNVNGGANRGLCYHWQKLVYNGIQPALAKTGWKATGIAINEGSFFEHHAVLVYDPSMIQLKNILKDPYKTRSYVLDPWSSGEPRVYTTADWLKLPVTIKQGARLTQVRPAQTASEPL